MSAHLTVTPERVLVVAVSVLVIAAGVNAVMLTVDVIAGQWGAGQWVLVWMALNAATAYALLAMDQWRRARLAEHGEILRGLKAQADAAVVILERVRAGDGQIVAEVETPVSGVRH